MRLASEPGIDTELEVALATLLHMSVAQRQNFLDHITELVDHDGIQEKAAKEMTCTSYDRLSPSEKAA